MQEWLEKYRDVPRITTNASIDKSMILFLGLTLTDFIAGVSIFIFVIMIWDSGYSIPVAIIGSLIASSCSKIYRTYFPPMFLSHFNWSFGFQKYHSVPNFFQKHRFKVFGA